MREENLTSATASGPGNQVLLIGSTTGRDGIGGASVLASQEFDERAEDKRPAVQVGDPFEEKLLIEACLELLDEKLLVGLGDCGAAGLTSCISEMADRAGMGVDVDVTKIPAREEAMKPFEFMVSESQERMVAVVEPGKLDAAQAVCTKWGLRATVIGEVTDTGRFIVREGDAIVADMPAATLAGDAPIYDPAMTRPAYLDEVQAFDPMTLDLPSDPTALGEVLLGLLASPNICSRRWIWEQYDHQVILNTVVLPGSDAAVLRIGDEGRGIAMSSDCNGRYCYLDPYVGAQIAFAEAARNVSASGGDPAAITDCLNFGSPEKPEVFWTFYEAIRGLSDACKFFGVPVISGNVSFYNESFGNAIYPTPMVGMLGVFDDVSKHCDARFKHEGDLVALLGPTGNAFLDGSEYQKAHFGRVEGRVPDVDLDLEKELQRVLREGIGAGLLKSAHDCAEGGLAVALAECCIASGVEGGALTAAAPPSLGAALTLPSTTLRPDVALFGEGPTRVIITCAPADAAALAALAGAVPLTPLGTVTGQRLQITAAGDTIVDVPVTELRRSYESLPDRLV
jgi:phosphoribosylformylglycinamidine synthase